MATIAPKLNGIKPDTFVYITIRDRWPTIVGKLVDHVHCNRRNLMFQYGAAADVSVKAVIHELSEMRYRMMTDKPLMNLNDSYRDAAMWNAELDKYREKNGEAATTWYKTDWLFVECYLYRRIHGAVYDSLLNGYDYFANQKNQSFHDNLQMVRDATNYMIECIEHTDEQKRREGLEILFKMCLWGNRCDLSLSGGDAVKGHSLVESARSRDEYILVNDFPIAIDKFLMNLSRNSSGVRQLDIVLDNAGLELLGDLVLAEYILEAELADKIVLHGKQFPWFVSDVTKSDFEWTLSELSRLGDVYAVLHDRLKNRVDSKQIELSLHDFWTYPHDYSEMSTMAPDLYAQLQTSSLVVFKGDLNYRKLVGDRDWEYTVPFKTALCGFEPAPILALRTLKAETVAGLSKEAVDNMSEKFGSDNKSWMVSGEYAVAQMNF